MRPELSSAYVKSILSILSHLGFESQANADIDTGRLDDPKYKIPLETVTALLERAEQALGSPSIGAHVGHRFRVHSFSETGNVLAYVETIAEAVELNARYQALSETVGRCRLEMRRTGDVMLFDTDVDSQTHRHVVEMIVAGYAVTTHWLGWSLNGGLKRAGFAHAAPHDTTAYETIFRCPVTFGETAHFIEFTEGLVNQPLPSHNPEKLKKVRTRLDDVLARVQAQSVFVQDLELAIRKAAHDGTLRNGAVHCALNLSPKQVSMKLREAGLTYQGEVDRVLESLCFEHMQSGTSLSQVAQLIGYSDQAAFSKAFKRWTGVPPSRYAMDVADS